MAHQIRPQHKCWYMFPTNFDGPRLYAILLEDGRIKFGSTANARARALSYSYDGVRMSRFHVFGPIGGSHHYALERRVIYALADLGDRIGKTEYFRNLDFDVVLRCARACINARLREHLQSAPTDNAQEA